MTPVTEPASYSMSRRGWISVKYDQRTWIPCPPVFPPGENRASWAALYAAEWWARSGMDYGDREAAALARTLGAIHDYAYGELPMHRGFIHLPDLTISPLLVSFGVWEAAGEPASQLRVLTHADDPMAMQPPLAEEFRTDLLGQGLKVLAYTRKDDVVTGHLNYAWRSEAHATALRMFTGSPDLGRLQRAVPDIERLARGVAIIKNG
jgi:hypothetical protein